MFGNFVGKFLHDRDLPSMNPRNEDIYLALSFLLSDRLDRVDWQKFSTEDWKMFSQIAYDEGVSPLIYWMLKDTQFPIPDLIIKELAHGYYNSAAHNVLLFNELQRVIVDLERAKIQYIVLKGAALALTLYPDSVLRPMGDIDLLVNSKEVELALILVQSLGFDYVEPEIIQGISRQVVHNAYLRGGSNGRIGLELHWNLIAGSADFRAVPSHWFWAQRVKISIDQQLRISNHITEFSSIFTLNPTAHLLYLAAHLMLRHRESTRLLWIFDIHRLITEESELIEWEVLSSQAHELGWIGVLKRALLIANDMFDTTLPDNFLLDLAKAPSLVSVSPISRKSPLIQTRFSSTWKALSNLDWKTRFRLAFALVIPRPTYLRWRYQPDPPWLWPLYYIYRWSDIFRDCLITIIKITKNLFLHVEE